MDKKELQNLIDRISLTGPEGIRKIKKVLKELNDGSGGGEGSSSDSMGEDEEYTIAQALNDLNDRLEAVEKRPIPKTTHVLTVLNTLNATDDASSFLESLLLDGETPTMEQIEDIDMDTIVKYGDKSFTISLKETIAAGSFYINCTFYDYSGGLCDGLQLGTTIATGEYYITTLY